MMLYPSFNALEKMRTALYLIDILGGYLPSSQGPSTVTQFGDHSDDLQAVVYCTRPSGSLAIVIVVVYLEEYCFMIHKLPENDLL